MNAEINAALDRGRSHSEEEDSVFRPGSGADGFERVVAMGERRAKGGAGGRSRTVGRMGRDVGGRASERGGGGGGGGGGGRGGKQRSIDFVQLSSSEDIGSEEDSEESFTESSDA
jgi:hypothetical protein